MITQITEINKIWTELLKYKWIHQHGTSILQKHESFRFAMSKTGSSIKNLPGNCEAAIALVYPVKP